MVAKNEAPSVAEIVAEVLPAMLPAVVKAMADAQQQAARQAEEEVRAEALAEIAARKAARAGRPTRRTELLAEELAEEVKNFRAGSTVKLRIHRGVHLFSFKDGDDRGEPAVCQPCWPDEIVECPINIDSVANQTSREMAAMKLKGWLEIAA